MKNKLDGDKRHKHDVVDLSLVWTLMVTVTLAVDCSAVLEPLRLRLNYVKLVESVCEDLLKHVRKRWRCLTPVLCVPASSSGARPN